MRTLLEIGDMIRIREDIKENVRYEMILNTDEKNSWLKDEMLPANTLVKIISIANGQYRVERVDSINKTSDNDYCKDTFWGYTDTMFDPEMLILLYKDRYN